VFKVQKLLLVPYFMRFFTSETTASSLLHEVLYFWDHCQFLTSWGSLLLRPLPVPYFMRFFTSETTDSSLLHEVLSFWDHWRFREPPVLSCF
jgi:hypothetical protein